MQKRERILLITEGFNVGILPPIYAERDICLSVIELASLPRKVVAESQKTQKEQSYKVGTLTFLYFFTIKTI